MKKSELEKTTHELHASEARLHRMIDEVQDYAIIFLSAGGIIENWNKGAQRIKGYTEAEAIGKSFRMFYPPEDQESKLPERLLKIALDEGKALHEGYRVRKDGTKFWGSIVITSIHDDQGNVIGFSKVTRDLTELKQAQDSLRQKNDELEKVNLELSSFAYVSSHDLQEPLRKIKSFAQRIKEQDYENLSEKSRDYFDRIQASAERMRALINDLLAYSRSSSFEKKFFPVDLTALVNGVIRELDEQIEERNATIELIKLPSLSVIEFQVHQLFVNLISNALKFAKPNVPLKIRIEGRPAEREELDAIRDGLNGDFYRISVADNGIGFKPEFRLKIFEVFLRLHNRNEYEGTGVGLSICRRIIENHGGVIAAEGIPNEGATFNIYLPVQRQPNALVTD